MPKQAKTKTNMPKQRQKNMKKARGKKPSRLHGNEKYTDNFQKNGASLCVLITNNCQTQKSRSVFLFAVSF